MQQNGNPARLTRAATPAASISTADGAGTVPQAAFFFAVDRDSILRHYQTRNAPRVAIGNLDAIEALFVRPVQNLTGAAQSETRAGPDRALRKSPC